VERREREAAMSRYLIAIAGSAEPGRPYSPALTNIGNAQVAAVEIGRELAVAGCDLVVYSSDTRFIETHVVQGYVESDQALPRSIQVRAPQDADVASFSQMQTSPELFDLRLDASDDWEVSFYRSLPEVDGLILIGGGRSVLIAGLIALTRQIPIVSVAAFGGSALKVWRLLTHDERLFEVGDLAAMAPPAWDQGSAARLVESLLRQRQRRSQAREEERRTAQRDERGRLRQWLVATLLFVASAMTVPLGIGGLRPGSAALLFLLFSAPLLAGASGATIRMAAIPRSGDPRMARAVTLGLAAGGICTFLFLMSQLAASPDLLTGERSLADVQVRGLLLFAVTIGFLAGFTFESVYRRLAMVDVVQLDALRHR
jgi:hypothetical protein